MSEECHKIESCHVFWLNSRDLFFLYRFIGSLYSGEKKSIVVMIQTLVSILKGKKGDGGRMAKGEVDPLKVERLILTMI